MLIDYAEQSFAGGFRPSAGYTFIKTDYDINPNDCQIMYIDDDSTDAAPDQVKYAYGYVGNPNAPLSDFSISNPYYVITTDGRIGIVSPREYGDG